VISAKVDCAHSPETRNRRRIRTCQIHMIAAVTHHAMPMTGASRINTNVKVGLLNSAWINYPDRAARPNSGEDSR
jgi:hypothetical protein